MNNKLKITTRLIVEEATQRGLSVEVLDIKKCFISITDKNKRLHLLRSNLSEKTPAVSYLLANHKPTARAILIANGLPWPEEIIIRKGGDVGNILERFRKVVVKPVDAAHGNGVTVGVEDHAALVAAIEYAQEYSKNVIVQEHVGGDDYRLLYIGDQLVAAAMRKPARVFGDGIHSIGQLIDMENKNPDRGRNYSEKMNFIDRSAAERYLEDRINEVPEPNKEVQVVGTANIGSGGEAFDVTEDIDARVVKIGLEAARALKLGLCAVDIIMDSNDPLSAKIIELNASPTFGMHEYPSHGSPRPVTKHFLDWLVD